MEGWHFDDERKEIVDNGVEKLVDEGAPREMSDGFKLIVEKQLWRHHDESKGVDASTET